MTDFHQLGTENIDNDTGQILISSSSHVIEIKQQSSMCELFTLWDFYSDAAGF